MEKERKDRLAILRHSASHVMADAVLRLFPEAKLGIGPAIDTGFYYDFELERPITPEDLKKIEDIMNEIIKQDLPFERFVLPRDEAIELMKKEGQKFKIELIEELNQPEYSFYRHGNFVDLCKGPHLERTSQIKAFKLLSVAGAYWRGDERREQMQRIYGTAFFSSQDLKEYLKNLEEAKKRDHRNLGRQMDLFSFHEEAPGFVFWHHKGTILYDTLVDFWKEIHYKRGYILIKTPQILRQILWEKSGHLENYKENMYFCEAGDEKFAVKPMNCPGGILVYKSKHYSYRDLPLRIGELGLVHRYERAGVLHGLFRVRAFTQDDAHIYCTPEQTKGEIKEIIGIIKEIYSVFGFKDIHVELSTRPEKFIGSIEKWNIAESTLREALGEMGLEYNVNEGDGAFYGPKIDFHIKDCMGRSWQCGTIQLDFNFPERFNLYYVGADDKHHQPVMLHRTVLGSMERFIGILIEHFGGKFPLWLAPEQVRVLPISDKFHSFALHIKSKIESRGIRVNIDLRPEKIGYKIREARLDRIPYMIILGEKEKNSNTISVRHFIKQDIGSIELEKFLSKIEEEISTKSLYTLF